ncbi:hypothetical protein ACFY5C_18320 [Streptomyces sp. NPDC012935]
MAGPPKAGAWIPTVAVFPSETRSGLPLGVGRTAVSAGAGRPPPGA